VQEQLAAIVYPVLTLPSDITSEIFLQYSDDYPTATCSPLLLARVALATHGIWARFAYEGRHPVSGRLAMWLSRAGKLPLHIQTPLPAANRPECVRIRKLLGAYAAQWETLDLVSDRPIFFPLQIQGPLPYLRTLTLSSNPSNYGVNTIPTIHDAPQLRHVKLLSIHLAKCQGALPWSQLTSLELAEIAFAQCLDILSQTQNLEILHFHLMSADPVPITRHIFPRLHSLTIGYDDSYSIIPHLILPALRQLHLFWPAEDCASAIEHLIKRSSCSPSTFILFAKYKPEVDLDFTTNSLSVIPTIKKLELVASAFKTASSSI
ncbi:hypothetical protein FB45DRAFT_935726, partial [Roridomyces roridus]